MKRYKPVDLPAVLFRGMIVPGVRGTATIDEIFEAAYRLDVQHYAEHGVPLFRGVTWVKTASGVRPKAQGARRQVS